jgi:CHAD domain-containing protein
MRVAMKYFGDFFDPENSHSAKRGLRKTGKFLGRVRDFDVLIEILDRDYELKFKEKSIEWRSFFLAIRSVWIVDRSNVRKKMLKHLDRKGFLELKKTIASLVQNSTNVMNGEYYNKGLNDLMVDAIHKSFQNVIACEVHIDSPPTKQLHELRIALKELRYVIEFFQNIANKKVTNCLFQLKTTQTILGEINDLDVLISRLMALNLDDCEDKMFFPELSNSSDFLKNQYITIKRETLDKKIKKFSNDWANLYNDILPETWMTTLSQMIKP